MNPFSALVIKDFRTYWFGSLFAMFGHRLIIVAISLLIYRLTGSALSLGIVAAATAIPIMFFNFLGGVISDKYNVRRILTLLSLSIAVILLILSYLDYLGMDFDDLLINFGMIFDVFFGLSLDI